MSRLLAIALMLPIAACAVSHPVTGSLPDGEALRGVMHMAADGGPTGTIDLSSSRTTCIGHYQIGDGFKGSVLITCADGRTGIGTMNFRPRPWTIAGTIGGQTFAATVDPSQTVRP
jgi:hypothetical protein